MSSETFRAPKPEKPINWNEILRCSFMFSQGDIALQNMIITWLATNTLSGKRPTPEDFKEGIVARYVSHTESHSRILLQKAETEETSRRSKLISEFQNISAVGNIEQITDKLILRDLMFLERENGRKIKNPLFDRDPYSSFIIDFGLLKKGTGQWTWDSLPDAYKQLWDSVMREISLEPQLLPSIRVLSDKYLNRHPLLSSDEKAKIESFKTPKEESA